MTAFPCGIYSWVHFHEYLPQLHLNFLQFHIKMLLIQSLLGLSTLSLALAKPTVYLIRHGEKPADGDGLNAQGEQRAQCLRNVFGASSSYNIGHIMAQTPKKSIIARNDRSATQLI